MYEPKTMDEYIDLVHQAIYDIDDLRACSEDDMDEMESQPFLEPLDTQLRKLYEDMIGGSYVFPADTDLPFMAIVDKWGRLIPFRALLVAINKVHRNGL